jgi:hypothetical protein
VDDTARDDLELATTRVRHWLANDNPSYRKGLQELTDRGPEGVKKWAAMMLFDSSLAAYQAICRNMPRDIYPHGYPWQSGWDVIEWTRTKVTPEQFEKIDAREFAMALDGDNRLGWEKR